MVLTRKRKYVFVKVIYLALILATPSIYRMRTTSQNPAAQHHPIILRSVRYFERRGVNLKLKSHVLLVHNNNTTVPSTDT